MSTTAPVYATSSGPQPQEVLEQLQKLLASRHLRESHQLQSFLEHVVRETLEGRPDGLKEYILGCNVFGRKPDYDPRHDGIVRVQATTLRKRLERYYAEEGLADRILIELPRGGYVPSFHYRTPSVELPPAAVTAAPPVVHGLRTLPAFLLGVGLTAMLAPAFWLLRTAPPAAYRLSAASPTDCPQIWTPFFEKGAHNLVGFGVPLFYNGGGIWLRDVLVNVPGQESRGRISEFARKFNLNPVPSDDTYTGIGEAVGTNLLSSFFTSGGMPTRIANARVIAESDLAGQNLVVLSSLRFQTLLLDLHLPAQFEFIGTSPEVIRNHKPLPGEKAEYVSTTGTGISGSYALISLWPGVTPGRRILSIGGIHTWATQAATEWLLNPQQLRQLSSEMQRDEHSGARGKVSPFFQILLRVEGRGNQSLKVEYVTHHYLPADTKVQLP